jgi:hypothetical protein
MQSERKMILILIALGGTALIARVIGIHSPAETWARRMVWDGFLVGMPVALAGLLTAG